MANVTAGTRITAAQWTDLKNRIDAERTRRNISAYSWTGWNVSGRITYANISMIRTALTQIYSTYVYAGAVPATDIPAAGGRTKAVHYNDCDTWLTAREGEAWTAVTVNFTTPGSSVYALPANLDVTKTLATVTLCGGGGGGKGETGGSGGGGGGGGLYKNLNLGWALMGGGGGAAGYVGRSGVVGTQSSYSSSSYPTYLTASNSLTVVVGAGGAG